jgi:hypothetical protein
MSDTVPVSHLRTWHIRMPKLGEPEDRYHIFVRWQMTQEAAIADVQKVWKKYYGKSDWEAAPEPLRVTDVTK